MPQIIAPGDSCEMVFPFRVAIPGYSTVHINLAHSQLWRHGTIIVQLTNLFLSFVLGEVILHLILFIFFTSSLLLGSFSPALFSTHGAEHNGLL
jgi:hypothetical protein